MQVHTTALHGGLMVTYTQVMKIPSEYDEMTIMRPSRVSSNDAYQPAESITIDGKAAAELLSFLKNMLDSSKEAFLAV